MVKRLVLIFTSVRFFHLMCLKNARKDANERYRDMGMLAVEMETAGLYMTAAYYHKKALSILTISDHVFRQEGLSAIERQESFREMMEIALETAHQSI
jgi:purine-nucleoside phosphorylase